MGRFVLLIIALFVLVWLLRSAFSGRPRRRDGDPGNADELVRCAHCGTHLPRDEALGAEGRSYCSAEHRRLGPRGS